MSSDRDSEPRPDRRAAQLRRDSALARVAGARRAIIVGAGALTAALAALVSVVAPGRSSAKAATPTAATSSSTRTGAARATATMPPPATAGQLGLQAPGSAPQAPVSSPQTQAQPPAAPAPAAPVSGGS